MYCEESYINEDDLTAILRAIGTVPERSEAWIISVIKEERKGKPALTKWVSNGSNWHLTDLDFCTMEQIFSAVGNLKAEGKEKEDNGNGTVLEWNMLQSGLGGTNCWRICSNFLLKNSMNASHDSVEYIWKLEESGGFKIVLTTEKIDFVFPTPQPNKLP